MINLLLAISILNTVLIIYLMMKLGREKEKLTDLLSNSKSGEEVPTEEDKKYIDDMKKMREMYESD
tara:strand:- start:1912 stop:2109 length:198 start_codon:yes stop_codon:yes gene_type:complete